MAGLTTTDKALTYSYLVYLNDLRGSGKLSEDDAEGLEGWYHVNYIGLRNITRNSGWPCTYRYDISLGYN